MREEAIYVAGKKTSTVFDPAVPAMVCPTIISQEIIEGVKYYIDSIGARYVAEIFDRVWGKRDSKAILPKQKRQFQRIRKF